MKTHAQVDPATAHASPFSLISPKQAEAASTAAVPASVSAPATPNTLSARLAFQTLTSFIPLPSLSWSPRSSAVASTTATAVCFSSDTPHSSISFPAPSLAFERGRTSVPPSPSSTSSSMSSSSISSVSSSTSTLSVSSFVNYNYASAIIRSPPAAAAKQPGYVAKEKQLERLRVRLEEERRLRALGAAVGDLGKLP